ncbi:MurR/RpiR family transcriptional regulator [Candidatus Gracilibacteria bacterium]|nr:MurR/RpiR family transcriptional regulator [Candidatus Gracilibacteria bacterium]
MNQPKDEQPIERQRYSPCLATIRSMYASLTEAERRVADYILSHRGWVLYLPIAEVARQSGVGLGTVARFCGKLGYSGYPDLKLALAVELLSPEYQQLNPITVTDDPQTVIRKTLQFGVQSLHDTAALLDPDALLQAALRLSNAPRVHVYATNTLSISIGLIAQLRLLTLGIHTTLFSDHAQQVTASELLRSGDIAIGLSNSGDSVPVAHALEAAQAAGATTVAITSAPQSLIAQQADICLLTASHGTMTGYNIVDADSGQTWWGDAVTSRIPMLSVIDVLYAMIALLKFRDAHPESVSRHTAG